MTTLRSDPLLTLSRGFLTLLIFIAGIGVVATAIGIPGVLIYRDLILKELAEQNGNLAGRNDLIWAFAGLVATGLVLCGLLWRFLVLLRRIVDSVATGDPFAPENAERLQQMGWLTIAGQVVTIPAALIGSWVATVIEEGNFDFDLSLGTLLLILVLFILARVFKRGAEMREELEGTV
jgi:hypothetical protein